MSEVRLQFFELSQFARVVMVDAEVDVLSRRIVQEDASGADKAHGLFEEKKALDRLVKQREDQEKEIARLTGKLETQDFVAKAPAEVLTEHRDRLRSLQHDQTMQASSEQQLRALLGA